MSAMLTAEEALKLVGEIFVYHMPFNRALGLELERYEKAFAQLSFNNQPMMVGNWAQSILHGGVIASALDVAAGLVCVKRITWKIIRVLACSSRGICLSAR